MIIEAPKHTIPDTILYLVGNHPPTLFWVPVNIATTSEYLIRCFSPQHPHRTIQLPHVAVEIFDRYLNWLLANQIFHLFNTGSLTRSDPPTGHPLEKKLTWSECCPLLSAYSFACYIKDLDFKIYVRKELEKWLMPQQPCDLKALQLVFEDQDAPKALKVFVVSRMYAKQDDVPDILKEYWWRIKPDISQKRRSSSIVRRSIDVNVGMQGGISRDNGHYLLEPAKDAMVRKGFPLVLPTKGSVEAERTTEMDDLITWKEAVNEKKAERESLPIDGVSHNATGEESKSDQEIRKFKSSRMIVRVEPDQASSQLSREYLEVRPIVPLFPDSLDFLAIESQAWGGQADSQIDSEKDFDSSRDFRKSSQQLNGPNLQQHSEAAESHAPPPRTVPLSIAQLRKKAEAEIKKSGKDSESFVIESRKSHIPIYSHSFESSHLSPIPEEEPESTPEDPLPWSIAQIRRKAEATHAELEDLQRSGLASMAVRPAAPSARDSLSNTEALIGIIGKPRRESMIMASKRSSLPTSDFSPPRRSSSLSPSTRPMVNKPWPPLPAEAFDPEARDSVTALIKFRNRSSLPGAHRRLHEDDPHPASEPVMARGEVIRGDIVKGYSDGHRSLVASIVETESVPAAGDRRKRGKKFFRNLVGMGDDPTRWRRPPLRGSSISWTPMV